MRICLVIPPSPFLIDDRVFPFLGPLQIGALARERGHDVVVADLSGYSLRHPGVKPSRAEVIAEAGDRLIEHARAADLVGFYSLAAQHPIVMDLFCRVRRHNAEIVCALGGPHANTAPERCVADGFNYVVVSDQGGGGGEPGFLELLARISAGDKQPIIKVTSREPGLKYQNDRWPLPARDLIDLPSYRYWIDGERSTSVVSSTGCPFACIYCSHWEGYRRLEAKSPQRVKQELDGIYSDYGIRGIMFYDDEINLRPDFNSEFLPMLKRQGTLWRAFFKNGPKLTLDSVFEAMADSGCRQLCTGAESANPAILKAIHKGATLEHNTDFVRLCVRHGIKPKVFTQVGLPGETPATVAELRDWLVAMAGEGLADADVAITTPYEGTPLYDRPDDFDLNWDKGGLDFSKQTVLYKTAPGQYVSHVWNDALSRDQMVAARDWVESEFRAAARLPALLAKDDG